MKKFNVGDVVRVCDGSGIDGFIGEVTARNLFKVWVRFVCAGETYMFDFWRKELTVVKSEKTPCSVGYGEKMLCMGLYLKAKVHHLLLLNPNAPVADEGFKVHVLNMIHGLRDMHGSAVRRNKWVIG